MTKHFSLGVGRVVVTLLAVFAVSAVAQTNKATLVGTVSDPTGAVVSGATVTVTNLNTGIARKVTTGDDGTYVVPLLDIGDYKIAADAPGFKPILREKVTVQTGDRLGVDIKFTEAAGGAEVVTVTAGAPIVQTESSDRGSVISGREVTELPLSGRNFTQLATLTPGVSRSVNIGIAGDPRTFNNGDPRAGTGGPGSGNENGQTETSRFARSGGASLSVNGQRPTNNNFSLDGVDNNEPQFGTIGVFPNPDAIAEFKVTTSIPPADVGRAGGAVISTTIKSGTNELHGSLYYYGQNSALNAYHPRLKTDRAEAVARGDRNLSPFDKAVQQTHEFGGTLGGPIIKNRTFFFFDYLGQRNNLPFPADTTVPTAGARNGDFTGYPQLFDPVTGQPFANNRIPSSRIDPIGQKYLNAYPLPTTDVFSPGKFCGTCTGPNFFTQRANTEEINNYEGKVDHKISDNNVLTGRYTEQRLTTIRANLLPGNIPTAGFGAGEERGDSRQVVVTDTHTFNPAVLNEFRFGLTQIQISIFNCGVGGACGVSPTFAQDIGIPNSNDGTELASGGSLIGNFGTGFLEFTGDGGLFQVKSKNPYFADSLTIVKGTHVLKTGGELRLRHLNTVDGGRTGALKGQFQYGDGGPDTGDNPNCPAESRAPGGRCYVDSRGIPFGGTGNSTANILLGLPANFVSKGQIFGGPFNLRSQEWGFFVQDDWKVTDSLTLNLGLRYDLFVPFSERNGRYSLYSIDDRRVIEAENGRDRIIEKDVDNFGPRIGFAYAIGPEKKMVVRGGYGLLYTLDGVDYPAGVRNPPFSNSVGFNQFGSGRTTTFSLKTGPPAVPQLSPADLSADIGVFAIDLEQETAYVHQYQLTFQYQFAKDWSLDIGYVGNRSRNLLYTNDIGSGGLAQAKNARNQFMNNALIYTNGAESSYNALQTQLLKRFSSNFQGQVSYTWSHTLDNSTGVFNGLGDSRNGRGGPINPFDLDLDRSSSSLDIRHLLSANVIIDLPFGKGQPFLDQSGAVDKIVGGWQVNIIQTARSGFPYSVVCGCSANRPSLIGDPFANAPPDRVLDKNAFSADDRFLLSVKNAANNTIKFGTLGRNTFTGPNYYNTDFSIFKNTTLTEKVKFQLGFEFFNLFNHANYTIPENNIQDGNFGRLRSAYPGRVVQYRGKIIF